MTDSHVILNFEDESPLVRALASCEVHCVWSCCGMDAYEVSAEQLQQWATDVDASSLQKARDQVAEILNALPAGPETFYFLDENHTRRDVREWFERIAASLAAVRPGR